MKMVAILRLVIEYELYLDKMESVSLQYILG